MQNRRNVGFQYETRAERFHQRRDVGHIEAEPPVVGRVGYAQPTELREGLPVRGAGLRRTVQAGKAPVRAVMVCQEALRGGAQQRGLLADRVEIRHFRAPLALQA